MKKELINTLIGVINDLQDQESEYFIQKDNFALSQVRPLIEQGISLAQEIAGMELKPMVCVLVTLYFKCVEQFYKTMTVIHIERIEKLQKGGELV